MPPGHPNLGAGGGRRYRLIAQEHRGVGIIRPMRGGDGTPSAPPPIAFRFAFPVAPRLHSAGSATGGPPLAVPSAGSNGTR